MRTAALEDQAKTTPASIVVAICLWIGAAVLVFLVAPVFSAMYADFGATLPLLTKLCFAFASGLRAVWFLSLPAFIGALIWISIALKRKGRLRMLFLISGVLAVGALTVALFLPVFYK